MKIYDAIKQITKGRKVQRAHWDVGTYLYLDHFGAGGYPLVKVAENDPVSFTPLIQDLLADDWVTIRHGEVTIGGGQQGAHDSPQVTH